jgi:hypothetical protein
VDKCKDTVSSLVSRKELETPNPTDLISNVSRMAPQPMLISSAVIYGVCADYQKLGNQTRFNENHTFLTTPNVLSKDRKVDCQKVRNTVIAYAP